MNGNSVPKSFEFYSGEYKISLSLLVCKVVIIANAAKKFQRCLSWYGRFLYKLPIYCFVKKLVDTLIDIFLLFVSVIAGNYHDTNITIDKKMTKTMSCKQQIQTNFTFI